MDAPCRRRVHRDRSTRRRRRGEPSVGRPRAGSGPATFVRHGRSSVSPVPSGAIVRSAMLLEASCPREQDASAVGGPRGSDLADVRAADRDVVSVPPITSAIHRSERRGIASIAAKAILVPSGDQDRWDRRAPIDDQVWIGTLHVARSYDLPRESTPCHERDLRAVRRPGGIGAMSRYSEGENSARSPRSVDPDRADRGTVRRQVANECDRPTVGRDRGVRVVAPIPP